MSIQTVCPACRALYTLGDEQRGKKVRCKKCQEVFLVKPAPRVQEDDEDLEERPRHGLRASASTPLPPLKRGRPARDEDEDEDESPRRRRHARDEEDEDETPRRRTKASGKKSGSGLVLILVGGGAAALLLLVVGVVAAVALGTRNRATPTQFVADNRDRPWPQPQPPVQPVGFGQPPGVGQPPDNGVDNRPPVDTGVKNPVKEPHDDPTPANNNGELDDEVREKVKHATVHLRVTFATGQVAQGSGFFGVEKGIILTNAHVMGMLKPGSGRPREIVATMNSGKSDEHKFFAQLLDVDRSSDLAVLKAQTNPMPEPLEVKSARNLHETQKVFIFGFPFGAELGKEISVSSSSVSSLREDQNTHVLTKVQVNGGMDPGNSGGPVVDTRGNVIGVSVSGIRGSQIDFAVPGDFVHVVLNGRILGLGLGQSYFGQGDSVVLPVDMQMIDPLNRIKEVALDVWTGDPPREGNSRPPATQQPVAVAGDSPHQRLLLNYSKGSAHAELTLPPLPDGKVYWFQPNWVNGANQPQWAAANIQTLASMPVRHEPATLALRPEKANRLLTLKSKSILRLQDEDGHDHPLLSNMVTQVNESVYNVTPQFTDVQLTYKRFEFGVSIDGKGPPQSKRLQEAMNDLGKLSLLLRFNNQGDLQGKPTLTIGQTSPASKVVLTDLNEQIQNSLNVVSIPLPNKQVVPGETWNGLRTLPSNTPGTYEDGAVQMTYTYQGTRLRNGRNEAVISLSGVVRGRGNQEVKVSGQASGTAAVDLNTGLAVEVHIAIQEDMTTKFFGEEYKASGTLEVEVQR